MDQHTRPHPHDDAGLSLVEVLVATVITVLIGAAGTALISGVGRMMTSSQASTQTVGQLESASTQLLRDVTDARQVIDATPSSLTLEVVRDTACVLTTWTADDDELRVSRTTFTQAPGSPGDPACASTGGERAEVRVVQRLTDNEPFEFFSRESTSEPLALPVSADDVARVTWALTATPAYPADADPRTVASGAAVAQSTGSTGGGASQDARAPLLEVVTPHEGVGQPVLRWADPTPAVTQAWTLFRIAYPEGGTAAGTWEALITLPGSQSTYTDASLPAGYTARYILRATLTDGRTGPTSPQVATGIRPAPVTLTATGQDASIVVSWTAATGATAYDLYRDGALYQQSLTGTSWTDATGRGHSHAYRVVPVSRWERCATRAATCTEALQGYQVPTGTLATTTLPGGSPTAVRRVSLSVGAWSAPLPVTGLRADRRAVAGPVDEVGSVWDAAIDVTWAHSAWTGGHAAAARAATRYAVVRGTVTLAAATSGTGLTDGSAPRGVVATYTVTPTASTLTGAPATTGRLTYPDAPLCSATATSTRSAVVGVGAVTGGTSYRSQLIWRSGAQGEGASAGGAPVPVGTILGSGATYDPLPHATAHSWRGQASASGGGETGVWGPWGPDCGATTHALPVPTPPAFPAPTCSGTPTGYAPATVSWTRSTAGSTSWSYRQATSPAGAGTYSAGVTRTESATTSDGHSTLVRSASLGGSCSATILRPPPPPASSPGVNSPECSPYRGLGTVQTMLDSAFRSFSPPAGTVAGPPSSGSSAADWGTYLQGSYAARNLVCTFGRAHPLRDSFSGMVVGEVVISGRWTQSGVDAT